MSERRKCESWPVVLPNDHGIRPAGRPDQCYYCMAFIGQKHGRECVTVQSLNRYDVLKDGVKVGVYDHYDPYFWDENQCNFHKNGSSWCTSNAIDDIKWTSPDVEKEIEGICNANTDEGDDGFVCLCGIIEFKFFKQIDEGPFVVIEDAQGVC